MREIRPPATPLCALWCLALAENRTPRCLARSDPLGRVKLKSIRLIARSHSLSPDAPLTSHQTAAHLNYLHDPTVQDCATLQFTHTSPNTATMPLL